MSILFPRQRLRLILVAVLGLLPVLAAAGPAEAAPAPSGPVPASVTDYQCWLFGPVDSPSAYVGNVCIAFEKSGTAIRTLGRVECRSRNGNNLARCQGSSLNVTIESNFYLPKGLTYECGVLDPQGSACATDGLNGWSPWITCPAGKASYKATAAGKVRTPDGYLINSGTKSRSWATNC